MELIAQETVIPVVKNNLKARRFGKGAYSQTLMNKTFFRRFRKKYPQYNDLDDEELRERAVKMWDGIVSIVINEPDGVMLGSNMGEMKLGLLRVHNIIDPLASKIAGKPVKFMNFSTNKKPGKFIWKTEYSRKINVYLRYIGFGACRNIEERCFKAFRTQGNIYKDISEKHTLIK